jgi:hypothetical protein
MKPIHYIHKNSSIGIIDLLILFVINDTYATVFGFEIRQFKHTC